MSLASRYVEFIAKTAPSADWNSESDTALGYEPPFEPLSSCCGVVGSFDPETRRISRHRKIARRRWTAEFRRTRLHKIDQRYIGEESPRFVSDDALKPPDTFDSKITLMPILNYDLEIFAEVGNAVDDDLWLPDDLENLLLGCSAETIKLPQRSKLVTRPTMILLFKLKHAGQIIVDTTDETVSVNKQFR